MATNVTERNKTLNEIIEWCETRISTINVDYTETAADVLVFLGERQALGDVADHCRSMLGYSGSMPSCLNYEDIDDSSPDLQPQVGDYGVAVLENAHGQEEIPFHVEREEHTGLPVALLNTRLYAKPEDDIDDGQYVSLFQLYLDGFMLSRTGRKRNKDAEA